MVQKSAIVIGASGEVGSQLMSLLLQDPRYAQIISLGRSPSEHKNDKLTFHKVDLLDDSTFEKYLNTDEIYCCIGTTRAKTPDKDTYRAIDHGIPVRLAKYSQKHSIPVMIVVSAMGADPDSRLFYNRTKGEMERDVQRYFKNKLHLVRPSLIDSERKELRLGERIGIYAMRILNPLLVGSLKNYRSISSMAIAKAMVQLANQMYVGVAMESETLKQLAEAYDRDRT